MSIYYYVYCNGVLGVRTNLREFKWVYGSIAPLATEDEYIQCRVRFDITFKPEKELTSITHCSRRFQSFCWDESSHILFYRRKLIFKLFAGFNIRIEDNTVYAEIGESYYRFVKNRIMNLHGIYYLLSDIANMVLLKNGLLTLYASSVSYAPHNRGIVCFSPPNTGKTCTAVKLCDSSEFAMLGEDIVITDGQQLFACLWTASFRKESNSVDSSGSYGRTTNVQIRRTGEHCLLTDVIVLSIGDDHVEKSKQQLLHDIYVLYGYVFNYFASPIVKVLGFMREEYCREWENEGKAILKQIVENCNCIGIQADCPQKFNDLVLNSAIFDLGRK